MQNNNKQSPDLNFVVGVLGWVSVFITSFLLLLSRIPSNLMSWSFFAFFLGLALMSGLNILVAETKIRKRQ